MQPQERERTGFPDTAPTRQPEVEQPASGSSSRSPQEQLRRFLRGASYDEGRERLRPTGAKPGPESGASREHGLLEGFLASPVHGPMHLRAPTGIGGFEASYSTAARVELLRIGGGVEFKDGITIEAGKLSTSIGSLRTEVRRLGNLPQVHWAHLLRPYQWTDSQKADWLQRLRTVVEGFWSGRFRFHATRPGWESLGATTALSIDVREGAKRADDHLALEVYRVPDDLSAGIGVLRSGGHAQDNRMTLASADVAPRADNLLASSVTFAPGATSPNSPATLTTLAIRFKAGSDTPPRMTWQVQGAGPGKQAEANARQRFAAIRDHMATAGFDASRLEFEFGGTGDWAFVVVGDGKPQNIAVHEFGHALGLKDEYAKDPGGLVNGTGKPAGTPSGHDALARQHGLPGSVHENHDGLMSFGNLMRPQYAGPYLWALKQVTRMPDWADGPPPESS